MDDICSGCDPRMVEYATVSTCDACAPVEPSAKEIARKALQSDLSCPICPPNRGENRKRSPAHGPKKPRKKDKR